MLKDKTAIITGAGRGIGRAISLAFAEQGANLLLNFHNSHDEAQEVLDRVHELGGKALIHQADVRNRDQVAGMFKTARSEFGQLDVLVNNAGILRDNLMLMTPEEDYDDIMDVNLKGTFNCIQYGAKQMMRKQRGKIINLASVVGRFGNAGQVVYAGSKAGVIGLTTSAAKELGAFGITVNAIAPGLIDTDMIQALPEETKQQLIDNTALKRIGQPEDVAKVALFLACDLSDYVSGQIIGVDGCQVI